MSNGPNEFAANVCMEHGCQIVEGRITELEAKLRESNKRLEWTTSMYAQCEPHLEHRETPAQCIERLKARLKAAELDAHTKDAFYGEKFAAQEIKLKAAEAWKAEARELLGTIEVASLRLGSWVKCSDWLLRRDALLAQEGKVCES